MPSPRTPPPEVFLFQARNLQHQFLVLEAASGCNNNFGGVGIAVAYVLDFQPTIIFEQCPVAPGGRDQCSLAGEDEATAIINTAGVIFNVTPTGVSSVAPGSLLNVIWQSPVTNCTLINTNVSNDIFISNIAVRFPTNQRGNEVNQYVVYGKPHLFQRHADFNLPYYTSGWDGSPLPERTDRLG